MNTWLQDTSYIDNEDTRKMLQGVLFNVDWLELAKEELGDDAEWDQIAEWIEDEYIRALSKINNQEYKQKLTDLFTSNLTPEKRVALAKEIQNYFNKEKIKVKACKVPTFKMSATLKTMLK